MGDVTEDQMLASFAEQARALERGGSGDTTPEHIAALRRGVDGYLKSHNVV
jgi:hypothetical protein